MVYGWVATQMRAFLTLLIVMVTGLWPGALQTTDVLPASCPMRPKYLEIRFQGKCLTWLPGEEFSGPDDLSIRIVRKLVVQSEYSVQDGKNLLRMVL